VSIKPLDIVLIIYNFSKYGVIKLYNIEIYIFLRKNKINLLFEKKFEETKNLG